VSNNGLKIQINVHIVGLKFINIGMMVDIMKFKANNFNMKLIPLKTLIGFAICVMKLKKEI
jgi:hypothetical protein